VALESATSRTPKFIFVSYIHQVVVLEKLCREVECGCEEASLQNLGGSTKESFMRLNLEMGFGIILNT
jgi:hypothetical protein